MYFSVQQVDGQDHLNQIRADRTVCDLHPRRRSRRPRRVLQMRDIVDADVSGYELITGGVRDLVDDDDARPAYVVDLG